MSGKLCIKNGRRKCQFPAPRCGGYVIEFKTPDNRHVLRSDPYATVAEAMEAMKLLSREMKDALIVGVQGEQEVAWPGVAAGANSTLAAVSAPCPGDAA